MAGKSKAAFVCVISILLMNGIRDGYAGGYKPFYEYGQVQQPNYGQFQHSGSGYFPNFQKGSVNYPTQTRSFQGSQFGVGQMSDVQALDGTNFQAGSSDSQMTILDTQTGQMMQVPSFARETRRQELTRAPDALDILFTTVLLLMMTEYIKWIFKE